MQHHAWPLQRWLGPQVKSTSAYGPVLRAAGLKTTYSLVPRYSAIVCLLSTQILLPRLLGWAIPEDSGLCEPVFYVSSSFGARNKTKDLALARQALMSLSYSPGPLSLRKLLMQPTAFRVVQSWSWQYWSEGVSWIGRTAMRCWTPRVSGQEDLDSTVSVLMGVTCIPWKVLGNVVQNLLPQPSLQREGDEVAGSFRTQRILGFVVWLFLHGFPETPGMGILHI